MKWWVIQHRSLWGDYGDTLISGYAKRGKRGELLLERTGPFLPPIFFPYLVPSRPPVVTEQFRDLLADRFPHLTFGPTVYSQVVESDWHTWPRDAPRPKHFPYEAEPEAYVQGQGHNRKIAASMGSAWEITGATVEGRLFRVEDPRGGYFDEFTGELPEISHEVTLVGRSPELLVNDDARQWFEQEVGEWIKVCAVNT